MGIIFQNNNLIFEKFISITGGWGDNYLAANDKSIL